MHPIPVHGWYSDTSLQGLQYFAFLKHSVNIAVSSLRILGFNNYILVGLNVSSEVEGFVISSLDDGVQAVAPAHPDFHRTHYYISITTVNAPLGIKKAEST